MVVNNFELVKVRCMKDFLDYKEGIIYYAIKDKYVEGTENFYNQTYGIINLNSYSISADKLDRYLEEEENVNLTQINCCLLDNGCIKNYPELFIHWAFDRESEFKEV